MGLPGDGQGGLGSGKQQEQIRTGGFVYAAQVGGLKGFLEETALEVQQGAIFLVKGYEIAWENQARFGCKTGHSQISPHNSNTLSSMECSTTRADCKSIQ